MKRSRKSKIMVPVWIDLDEAFELLEQLHYVKKHSTWTGTDNTCADIQQRLVDAIKLTIRVRKP